MTDSQTHSDETLTATVDVRGVGSSRGVWWSIRIIPDVGSHYLEARLPIETLGWWFWSVHRPNRLLTVDPVAYPLEVRHRYTHTQLLIGGDSTNTLLTVWVRDCASRRLWLLTPSPVEWGRLLVGLGPVVGLSVVLKHNTEPLR